LPFPPLLRDLERRERPGFGDFDLRLRSFGFGDLDLEWRPDRGDLERERLRFECDRRDLDRERDLDFEPLRLRREPSESTAAEISGWASFTLRNASSISRLLAPSNPLTDFTIALLDGTTVTGRLPSIWPVRLDARLTDDFSENSMYAARTGELSSPAIRAYLTSPA